jgi:voltage-gated sodium channel
MAEFPAADHGAVFPDASGDIYRVHLCDLSLGDDKHLTNASNAPQSVLKTNEKCSVQNVLPGDAQSQAACCRGKCTGKRLVKKRSPKAVRSSNSNEMVFCETGETFVEAHGCNSSEKVRCGPGKPPVESEVESTPSYNEQDPLRTRKPAWMAGFHEALEEQQHRIVERIVQRVPQMTAVQAALEEQQERIIQRVMQELYDTTAMLRNQHEESLRVLKGIGARKGLRPVFSVEHELALVENPNDLAQPSTTKGCNGLQSQTPLGSSTTDSAALNGPLGIINDSVQLNASKLQPDSWAALNDTIQCGVQKRRSSAPTLGTITDSSVQLNGAKLQPDNSMASKRKSFNEKHTDKSVTFMKRLKQRATRLANAEGAEGGGVTEFEDWYENHQKTKKMDKGMFPDKNQMKKQLQESLIVKQYDVRDCYWESGIAQRIARAPLFENATLLVIGFNAVWLAVDTDHNPAQSLAAAATQFQVAENLFALYFSIELLLRFASFEHKRDSLNDFWFVFDSVLVMQVVVETWVMYFILWISDQQLAFSAGPLTLLKIVRLCRTARLVRLLRQFPELVVLIRGIGIAIRSVFFTLVLLVVITYVFSISLKILTENNVEVNNQYFPTVWIGVKNMLLWAIVPDLEEKFDILTPTGFLSTLMFTAFIFITTVTILNMLVGVIVEVVNVVSSVEREQLELKHMREGLWQLLLQADTDCSGEVTIKEFVRLLQNKSAVQFLDSVGIDAIALVDISEYLFKGCETYEYVDMVGALLELRGTNSCTVKDIVSLRKWLSHQLQESNDNIIEQGKQLNTLSQFVGFKSREVGKGSTER